MIYPKISCNLHEKIFSLTIGEAKQEHSLFTWQWHWNIFYEIFVNFYIFQIKRPFGIHKPNIQVKKKELFCSEKNTNCDWPFDKWHMVHIQKSISTSLHGFDVQHLRKIIQHLFFAIEKYYLLKYQPFYFWETHKDATKVCFIFFNLVIFSECIC